MSFSLVIEEEKADSRAEVKTFDKSKLKHVETEEKNPTPTSQTLREELLPDELPNKAAELKEIEGFDAAKKLKHVETTDKTHLPTKEGMVAQGRQNFFFTKIQVWPTFGHSILRRSLRRVLRLYAYT